MGHPSSSIAQQNAEAWLLREAASRLGVQFTDTHPPALRALKLDGYAEAAEPVCVEVFAHVGPCKDGQKRKLSRDMTKLLLAERWLGKDCRKVIVVVDAEAIRHFSNGWDGEFAKAFGIETLVVNIEADLHRQLLDAQARQRR
jgi:hypothetical protein